MPTPEQDARHLIDELLTAAGWQLQDSRDFDRSAAPGVAVREFSTLGGFADYLLFVGGKAVGAIEAKAMGATLSGVELQSRRYGDELPPSVACWTKPLPFLYESTGVETFFTNRLDPEPRSRRLFAFHRPALLQGWAEAQKRREPTMRAQLRTMPPLLTTGLWPAQVEAITRLDQSLAADRPRALIQMATGSGKTVTAISAVYRLIKYGGARRVLFLVDRSNLGRQALAAFQQYVTPDDGRKFSDLYPVQQMTSNLLDPSAKVVITTIQRLYSILAGESDFDAAREELSMWEQEATLDAPRPIGYSPALPIEGFDVIVIDECHRSIYNLWRQVLEYFDAHLIGLTATPSAQTLGFFNQNLVMEYPRERAVADGVNVDGEVYRIRTRISEAGSRVEAGYAVRRRDRRTRQQRWEDLDEPLVYDASQLDRDVVAVDQIRTVIRTFRDRLFTDLFPQRTEVPKTLIFAKDDSHAEEIVRIVREEFGRGNDFCRKITYKVSGVKPEELISDMRNQFNPRIAVTVDMVATGTDIKPLEILLFMRQVKSALLYEQMLGRGTRVIAPDDLQRVTGDAPFKDRFVIVDAVGVTENPKVQTTTLERKRTVPLKQLLREVAGGAPDADTLSSLARRLATLAREQPLSETMEAALLDASGGLGLRELAGTLLDALDSDRQVERARTVTGEAEPSEEAIEEAAATLREEAALPFARAALRQWLLDLSARYEQTIDEVSRDVVREAGWDTDATERARGTVAQFAQFVEENRDRIDALQILYERPYGQRRLTRQALKALAEALEAPPRRWTPAALWDAYERVERDCVRGSSAERQLTDLVALVRHAVAPSEALTPYTEQVQAQYEAWLADQARRGRPFSEEQRRWLDRIAAQVGVDMDVQPEDVDDLFAAEGGRLGARRVLGNDWQRLLAELNEALAA